MDIDPSRLLADLRTLADFGRREVGIHRPAFSAADMEARRWLVGRMAEAGLEAAMDGIGNVLGRSPGPAPALLIGSHTDTVPGGGWLDGSLGVAYGLEIARARAATARSGGGAGEGAVDVISFQDEEGAHVPLFGSRSFCGEIDGPGAAAGAIEKAGLAGRNPARLESGRYLGYLEAHIEQGPRLETAAAGIGIVTSLVGIRRYLVRFRGRADHAGTTPMELRRDAGAAAVAFAQALRKTFQELAGAGTVWNVGAIHLEPGTSNIVPAVGEVLLEIRDPAQERLEALEQAIHEGAGAAAREFSVSGAVERAAQVAPAAMDEGLRRALADAARVHGAPSIDLTSGAGHDAMIMSRHLPAAMLFVPSIGGRSHCAEEDTKEADIVLGCRVMATAAAAILDRGAINS